MVDNERELRVALRDAGEPGNLADRKKHDGKSSLLGCRPEPIGGSVGEPSARRGRVERHAHAEHARLLLPCRQQRRRFRVLQRNAAHDSEAAGITLGGFERIVVAIVQARRHDDYAVDASLVHHWQRALDGEWFRQLRPGTCPASGEFAFQKCTWASTIVRLLAGCGRTCCALVASAAPATIVVPNLRRVRMMVVPAGAVS